MAIPSFNAKIDKIDVHRKLVLSQSLAQGIDTDEVRQYLASLSENRFASHVFQKRGDDPYIQPRGGVPRFENQRKLSLVLSEAGADFIPLTIDSYTRQNQYDTAAELLQRSEDEEKDYLNGYPLLSHGYELTRDLYCDIEKPVSLRHGTPDARLLIETAIAAGITDIEGGGICYCLPYSEGFPLDRCLLYWQYVDRVCAFYSTPSRPIHRESFGPLTATMVPPCMTIVVQIVEALLAAEQGVTSFTVSFGQTGSIAQDIAVAKLLRTMTREILTKFGFEDVQVYLAYHQWMGQFPVDRSKATALITCSALIARLVDADKIIVKTVDEALGVPAPEVNADAAKVVKYVFETFQLADELESDNVALEMSLIRSEAELILEYILELPGDAFWQSVYRAFQQGAIDIPFSPHSENANNLITLRNSHGSIRIVNPGGMPISKESLELEESLLNERVIDPNGSYKAILADISIMA